MFRKYKNIIIIVIIIIIAGAAYTLLTGNTDDRLLVSDTPSDTSSVIESDLLTLLLDIRSVKLNGDIFSDPIFRSLEDFGQDLVPEPVGRDNPFAPIGLDANQESEITNQEEE